MRQISKSPFSCFCYPTDVIDFKDATVKNNSASDTAAILSAKVKTSEGEFGDTIEREVKLNDKTKALELLGNHLGMFKDNEHIQRFRSQKYWRYWR